MKNIGVHIEGFPTFSAVPELAHSLGARAFAFTLGDPSRWSVPAVSAQEAQEFRAACERFGFTPSASILPHSAFVINLGSPDARKLHLSRKAFTEELERCHQLGLTLLNFHPGAHLRQITEEQSLRTVSDSLNFCLERTEGVKAVIENTAGQGSTLGYSFEHLRFIIDNVEQKERVGVCIDTCHAYAAGYDFGTPAGYEKAWKDFEQTVGFEYLCGMHINDSLRELGSRIDRHESIGRGRLGSPFFSLLMADPRIDNIPMILETPDTSLWKMEMEWLNANQKTHID